MNTHPLSADHAPAREDGDDLLFLQPEAEESDADRFARNSEPWKVLIVDDDTMIHDATRLALAGLIFNGRPLKLFNEYSGESALRLLRHEPSIAVILLDVVMEHTNSGLEVVKRVRNDLKNRLVRIILRTGQPGYTPEQVVTAEYDINDYKEKSELTQPKLISAVTLALRGYSDLLTIQSLATSKETLELLVRDRTLDLRQLNDELEQRNVQLIAARFEADAAIRTKSVILSSISHELRTPLNAVIGYAQLLDMSTHLTPGDREAAQIIHQSGRHLLALIDNMIDLSHIEAGELELNIEPVPIRTVIDDCLTQAAVKADELELKLIDADGDGGPVVVAADHARLHQVVSNLLSNAIKYNRPHGSIRVWCSAKNGTARVSIADTGVGIAPANQAKIFNAFDRLGAEFGTIEGTGIGLIISKRLTEAMGGQIGFESVEHQGSTFWVEFKALAQATG